MSSSKEESKKEVTGAGAEAVEVDPNDFDPMSLIQKKPGILDSLVQPLVDKFRKKKYENEKRMLRREEQMKQDVERILMELEEQRSWVTGEYVELNHRNLIRLRKEELVDKVKRDEAKRVTDEELVMNTEQGLSYHMGNIHSFNRFQNSSSKFQDISGHKDAVLQVKLSKCLEYAVSVSADKTAKLWHLKEGKTRYPLITYTGHTRKVLTVDLHPHDFENETSRPVVVTGSADGTMKFWNTLRQIPVRSVEAHAEAIYQVRFSSEGTRVISASEDKTLKLWSFPEGFSLYTYTGHASGVTSCAVSPTGKWLVSGSDYGERKIMLWDASMPVFEKPTQYPHMLFWTPEGLIKKILIRGQPTTPFFWMTGEQLQIMGEKARIETWIGEYDDIEVESESDSDDDGEDKIMEDVFTKNDIREIAGATLNVYYVDKEGKRSLATEYMAGGQLTVDIACADVQMYQAYVTVTRLDTAYDMFIEDSGMRLGHFLVSYPLPWEMDTAKIDPVGLKKPERVGDDLPAGLEESDNGQGLLYQNDEAEFNENGDQLNNTVSKFGCVWFCPGPDMGPARVSVNFKFQGTDTWETLTYSLRESPIRMASAVGKDGAEENVVQYTFDQEQRHIKFFNFIREKNWDAVQTFLDKKCVMFKDKVLKKRRWRCMDSLEDIFMDASAMVIPSPIIFKGGLTKSTVMMEYTPWFYNKRPETAESEESSVEESDDDDDEEEDEGEGSNKKDDGAASAAVGTGVDDKADEGRKVEEVSVDIGIDDGDGDEDEEGDVDEDADEDGEDEDEEGEDDSGGEEGEEEEALIPIAEEPEVSPESGDGAVTTDGDASSLTAAEPTATVDEEATVAAAGATEGSIDPAGAAGADDVGGDDQDPKNDGADEEPESKPKAPVAVLSNAQVAESASMIVRRKARKQHLAEFIFTGEVEGKHFSHEVERLAEKEIRHFRFLRVEGMVNWKEVPMFPVSPHVQSALSLVPTSPSWVQKAKLKRVPDMFHHHDQETHFYRTLKHPYVKSTLYGPDIQRFSMPLPELYPKRAGKAANALRMQLSQYEASRHKEASTQIPMTAVNADDSDDDEDGSDKKGGGYGAEKTMEQKYHAMLDVLRPHVALHLLQKRTYLSTRRNCLPLLPGMKPHYPNPEYKEPAIEFNGYFRLQEKGKGDGVYELSAGESRIVPPVGRRREYPEHFRDIAQWLIDKREEEEAAAIAAEEARLEKIRAENRARNGTGEEDEEKKEEAPAGEGEAGEREEKMDGIEKGDEEKKEGDHGGDNQPNPEETVSPRPGTQGSNSSRDVDSGGSLGIGGLGDTSPRPNTASADELDAEAPEKHRHHSHKHHHHDDIEPESEPEPEPEDPAVIAAREEEQRLAALAAADRTWRKERRIPEGVWLHRRGSFCFSPGLEPFEDGAKTPPSHDILAGTMHKQNDPKRTLKQALKGGADDDDSGLIDLNKRHGLLRKFKTLLGNEIVHHGAVNDLVFAPSETRVASAGGDGMIKVWDPRDGTLARILANGHDTEVTGVRYSNDELYLVSTGADMKIVIWDTTTNLIFKRLLGHIDVITSLDMSPDCTLLISSSYDKVVKTWYLTPRVPGIPDPPRVISRTDKTAMLAWSAPPAFNLDTTAFYIQHRIGLRNGWEPVEDVDPPITVMPQARSTVVAGLIAGTHYQFRIRAENKMGIGMWSAPSKMVTTEMGRPDETEMPLMCGATTTSLDVYFFTPNPEAYGGASQRFEARWSGNGTPFEDSPIIPFTLEDGVEMGKKYVRYFKDQLTVKKLVIIQRKDERRKEVQWDPGFKIAKEFMADIIRKVEEDDTHLMAAVTIDGLEPGFEYRIELRGVNDEDVGPWSKASYSQLTHPTFPLAPAPPFIEERSLTSIKFAWHAPDSRGTAITGYWVQRMDTGKMFKLERSQQWLGSPEMDHLLPGKSYYIRVKAMNSVGESEWGQTNSFEQSHTLTDKPEKPSQPIAVAGTWRSMDLEIKKSYNNGDPITKMTMTRRWVESFRKGEWDTPVSFEIEPNLDPKVVVTNFVEDGAYVKMLLEEELREIEESKKGYNPMKMKKNKESVGQILARVKPEGSTLRLTVENCEPDKIYEFKIAFSNSSGESPYSDPSHRAKTNKDASPEPPKEFTILEVEPADISSKESKDRGCAVIFRGTWERHGGAQISKYVIETRDNTIEEDDRAKNIPPEASEALSTLAFIRERHTVPIKNVVMRVPRLVPGHSYSFRVRADNEGLGQGIDMGKYSPWSEEVDMPELPEDDEDEEDQPLSRGAAGAGTKEELDEGGYSDTDGDDDDDEGMSPGGATELPTTRRGGVLISGVRMPGEEQADSPGPGATVAPNRSTDRRKGFREMAEKQK
jgi:WD40 repeat protein